MKLEIQVVMLPSVEYLILELGTGVEIWVVNINMVISICSNYIASE